MIQHFPDITIAGKNQTGKIIASGFGGLLKAESRAPRSHSARSGGPFQALVGTIHQQFKDIIALIGEYSPVVGTAPS